MRKSAGIILYRRANNILEVFLVHPGGPYWQGKEEGAWTIPKGEFSEEEDPLDAAKREFQEETGFVIEGNFIELGQVQQKAGKLVLAWAAEGDIDANRIKSNTFRQEWPYKSGVWCSFPEVDKGAWFSLGEAQIRINPAQYTFLERLSNLINISG